MSADAFRQAAGPRHRAARTAPPEGLLPGQLSTVLGHDVDRLSIVATIVDLAVRGRLAIQERSRHGNPRAAASGVDWDVVVVDDDVSGLSLFEEVVVAILGRHGGRAAATALMSPTWLGTAGRWIDRDVAANGWTTGPDETVVRWRPVAAALVALGVVGLALVLLGGPGQVFWTTTLGLVVGGLGAVLTVAGAVLWLTQDGVPTITREGAAVRDGAEQFRQYLQTADAGELERAHGVEGIVRYAPWAIASGLVERWAQVLGKCSARGSALPTQRWFVPEVPADVSSISARTLGTRLEAFTDALVGPAAPWRAGAQTGHAGPDGGGGGSLGGIGSDGGGWGGGWGRGGDFGGGGGGGGGG